jgi:hypothetical protein
MSKSKAFTSKQYLSQLNLIYYFQAGVMLVFAAVVFGLVYSGKIATDMTATDASIHTYALIFIVVAGFSAAHYLYQYRLSKIDKTLDLRTKMPKYLGALLLRSACLELPGLYASVVFFLSGNYYLLLIPIFSGVAFFLLRPTVDTIADDMALSPKEKSQLNNPNIIIAEQ